MTPYIDGVSQGHNTYPTFPAGQGFTNPMFILINLAVGGDLGGPVQVSDWTKATLDVDYVRWYQSGGSNTCSGAGSCVAETNTQFCQRLGKSCGSVTAADNCGTSRTVSNCGSCNAPTACSANICDGGTSTTIQAESYASNSGISTETCTDTG